MLKHCRVVIDTDQGPWECEIELPEPATVAEALEVVRLRFAEMGVPDIDWGRAAVGIFGQPCARSRVPLDGDRIEVYRPLQIDPRQSRRSRAARAPPTRGRR